MKVILTNILKTNTMFALALSLSCMATVAILTLSALANESSNKHNQSSQGDTHTPAYHKEFKKAKHWSKKFDDPERDKWQLPEQVISNLGINDKDVIADIGAGTGYFVIRIAKQFPNAKVIGTDIEPDMISFLKKQAKKRKLSNLSAVQIDAAKPELPEKATIILIVDTLHHIDNRIAYLEYLKKSLSQDGKVVIIDFKPDSPEGPPAKHRLPTSEVISEFEQAGFKLDKQLDFLANQYFLVFK